MSAERQMVHDGDAPVFWHFTDQAVYDRNVEEGKPLCERCSGGGNELMSMYRACSDCGGSGINLAAMPAPPTPTELVDTDPPGVGGACVAPAWPEWATTEDGDIVWVRLDLEERAAEVAGPGLEVYGEGLKLERSGREAMVLDRMDTDWSEEWLLRRVDLDSDPQDAAVYVRFDVVESFDLDDEEDATP